MRTIVAALIAIGLLHGAGCGADDDPDEPAVEVIDVERDLTPERRFDFELPDPADRLRVDAFLHAAALGYRQREAAARHERARVRAFRGRILRGAGDRFADGVDVSLLERLAREHGEGAETAGDAFRDAAEPFAGRATAAVRATTADAGRSADTPMGDDLAKLGLALSYTTLLNAPGSGADLGCTSTPFVILGSDEDHTPGPLFQYLQVVATLWDGETGEEQARAHVLGKLAELLDALQCMSTRELAEFEGAFAAGLIDIFNQLAGRRSLLLARAFWDATLPVTLLLYDAVKYFKVPVGYYVLRIPRTMRFDLPRLPRSVPVRVLRFDGALASFMYCAPHGGSGLTLNRIGIWFEDPRQAEGGLGQVTLSPPCDLLRDMTNLPRLGEGECPMLLFAQWGNSCPGENTCDSQAPAGGEFATQYLGGGIGEIFERAGARPTAPPGMPGSALTHFGTRRGDAIQQGCESSGGAGAAGCFMPSAGGPRPGQLSRDPEMDRVLRCGLAVAGQSAVPIRITMPGRGCLVGGEGDDSDAGSGDAEESGPDIQGTANDVTEEEAEQAVRDAADELEERRQEIIRATDAELRRRGHPPLTLMQRLRLEQSLLRTAQMARDGRITFTFEDLPGSDEMQTLGVFVDSTSQAIADGVAGGWIMLHRDTNGDVGGTMLHELVHAALSAWSVVEAPRGFGGNVEPLGEDVSRLLRDSDPSDGACAQGDLSGCSAQHRIIRGSGTWVCDAGDGCTDSCRYVDPRVRALTECVADSEPLSVPRPSANPCATALSCPRDSYTAFYTANLQSCLSEAEVDLESVAACAHVLCDASSVASSHSHCCRGAGAGIGGALSGPPPWCRIVRMDPPPPDCPGGGPAPGDPSGGVPSIMPDVRIPQGDLRNEGLEMIPRGRIPRPQLPSPGSMGPWREPSRTDRLRDQENDEP